MIQGLYSAHYMLLVAGLIACGSDGLDTGPTIADLDEGPLQTVDRTASSRLPQSPYENETSSRARSMKSRCSAFAICPTR